MPQDFTGIINAFGSVAKFCEATGKPDATVRAWMRRDLIPVDHWDDVINAALRHRLSGISVDTLYAAVRISRARARERERQAGLVSSIAGRRQPSGKVA